MRLILLPAVMCFIFGMHGVAWAQNKTKTPGALQASNILNPNISAIGWFQGEAGRRHAGEEVSAFQFKEVEVSVQSIIDPYARADFFIAVEPPEGKVELEEGYITWFNLPYNLALRAGKMKGNFGKFNRAHRPETAFADRPLAHEAYFGEEGLSGAGGSLSWHVPNPWLFVNLDAEVLTSPEAAKAPAFDKARKKDLLYIGRANGYYDLTESANIAFGGNYAYGSAGHEFNVLSSSSSTLKSQLYGMDLTFRWKNPRRAIYRSLFWQTEVFWNKRDLNTESYIMSAGLFSHLEYQFTRRWRTGGRYDWTESPTDSSKHDQGGLYYLTFMPSEFNLISLQGRHVKRGDGSKETLGWLKVTFNIGPHGTHPF